MPSRHAGGYQVDALPLPQPLRERVKGLTRRSTRGAQHALKATIRLTFANDLEQARPSWIASHLCISGYAIPGGGGVFARCLLRFQCPVRYAQEQKKHDRCWHPTVFCGAVERPEPPQCQCHSFIIRSGVRVCLTTARLRENRGH
jgi:hypothetical protein